MPFESSATATTATNSATYLMNSRLLACPAVAAAGDAAIAWSSERASDRASDRPWGVSGCREMVIGHLLARRPELVSCRNAVGLFNDLVGQRQQRRRKGQAHGRGGLEIENQGVAGRLLEGQIGRTRPLKYPGDQIGGPLEAFIDVGAVR